MSVIKLGDCNCRCHTKSTFKHVGPCCSECPYCSRRVKTAQIKSHMETCILNPNRKKDEPEVE